MLTKIIITTVVVITVMEIIIDTTDITKKTMIMTMVIINLNDNDEIAIYYSKYREFLVKNSLKIFTKDILELKF